MPTGDYAAGVEPAGFDPVVAATPRTFDTPAAVRFDASGRVIVQDASGILTECHPVDQRMAFGLIMPQGAIASAPEIGHRLKDITNPRAPDTQTRVESAVRNAVPVAELLANGDVAIDQITHRQRAGGGLVVFVYYHNLRVQSEKQRVITYPAQ